MDHNKVVPLTSEKVKGYLKNLKSDQLSADLLNQTLDLAKEFRSKDYPLIHLLLQNPLAELISAAVPSPSSCTYKPSSLTTAISLPPCPTPGLCVSGGLKFGDSYHFHLLSHCSPHGRERAWIPLSFRFSRTHRKAQGTFYLLFFIEII